MRALSNRIAVLVAMSFVGLLSISRPVSAMERGVGLSFNVPHIYNLSYETLAKEKRYSWSVGGGYLPPISFTMNNTPMDFSVKNLNVRGRWHPFAGGFFLGLGFGWQSLGGSAIQTIDVGGTPVPAKVELDLSNLYLTPHLGWFWTLGGFLFGVEAGWQLGLGGTVDTGVSITDPSLQALLTTLQSDPDYIAFQNRVESGFSNLGKVRIPYGAVRLGWTF